MDYSNNFDVQELKALAYDAMATAENAQSHLQAINARIAQIQRQEAEEKAKESADVDARNAAAK